MRFITNVLALGLLVNVITAQISFFDQRFPPAPATRRTIVIRNGQLSGRRSAALQQAPDQQINEPLSQQYEDSAQEQELNEPIVEEPLPVPTQRPQRNGNGITQQQVPSRAVNGFPRIPQQKQEFGQTVGSQEQESDEVSQRQDSALTDISMEDISIERVTPGVTFTSSQEETTDDGFTPTEPEQKAVVTTIGSVGTQRKTNGNGRQRQPNGRKTLVPSQQKPVGNGRKPSNGRDRQQVIDTSDAQVTDGQLSDGQISGDQTGVEGGQDTSAQAVDAGKHEGDDHHHDHHSGDAIQWLRDAINGEPGVDYPIFYTPPETGFKCSDQQLPGYYADVEARCQVFHICQDQDHGSRSDAFLCPNGTIFSQQTYVCVWWHQFDCSTAPQFYSLNAQLYSGPETGSQETVEPLDRSSGPTRGQPSTDAIGGGSEGPADERIQTTDEQGQTLTQEVDLPQVIESDGPQQQQTSFGDSQEVSDEGPAQESFTTSAPINGVRAPNGRPSGGIKGVQKSRVNGMNGVIGVSTSRANGANRKGQNGDQQRVSVTTTRPIDASKRNGGSKKKNGKGSQASVPSSPADTARNGLQKTLRMNGANGSSQRKRPNGGTKSVFRDRTTQSKELDGQTSNRVNRWYYLTGL